MPTLIRFTLLLLVVAGSVLGGLYAAATFMEPKQTEIVKPINAVTVR